MLATPDPMTQQAELADSVTKRLRQASEINSKQSRISPNAADLTYNNLELEKLSILQTILRDGFDPLITIRLDRGDQQMKLSSYIAQIQRSLN